MSRKIVLAFIAIYSLAAGLGFYLSGNDEPDSTAEVASYILQGRSTAAVVAAVRSVNGTITHEFSMINAVAATLTLEQRDDLLVNPAIIAINEEAPAETAVSGARPSVSFAVIDSAGPTPTES